MTAFKSGPYPAFNIRVAWLQGLSPLPFTNFRDLHKAIVLGLSLPLSIKLKSNQWLKKQIINYFSRKYRQTTSSNKLPLE